MRKMFFFTLLCSTTSMAATPIIDKKLCHSSKEYITTFRYLEGQKQFSLKRDDLMKIADSVSQGCENSAKRFIDTNELLIKAGLETSDALKISMKFSLQSNESSQTFTTIFKEAFLKDYLDLDLKTATELALKLATNQSGDAIMIRNDFQNIVKFCLENKGLDLSGPKCSELASKIANYGVTYKQEMGRVFVELFDFLTKKSGANLTTYKGLEIALKMSEHGPFVAKNFQEAYRFAISKKGLDLTKNEAINFSELMAKRSSL